MHSILFKQLQKVQFFWVCLKSSGFETDFLLFSESNKVIKNYWKRQKHFFFVETGKKKIVVIYPKSIKLFHDKVELKNPEFAIEKEGEDEAWQYSATGTAMVSGMFT